MHYPSSDPQHIPFLEEIAKLPDFNNLYMHLPGPRSWYEGVYARRLAKVGEANLPEETRQLPLMWRAIDDYVAQEGLDVTALMQRIKLGESDPQVHDRAQLALAPLYIFLRERGFSQHRIIG